MRPVLINKFVWWRYRCTVTDVKHIGLVIYITKNVYFIYIKLNIGVVLLCQWLGHLRSVLSSIDLYITRVLSFLFTSTKKAIQLFKFKCTPFTETAVYLAKGMSQELVVKSQPTSLIVMASYLNIYFLKLSHIFFLLLVLSFACLVINWLLTNNLFNFTSSYSLLTL